MQTIRPLVVLAAWLGLAAAAAAQELDPWFDGGPLKVGQVAPVGNGGGAGDALAFPTWSPLAGAPLGIAPAALPGDYDGAFAGPGLSLELGSKVAAPGHAGVERADLEAGSELGLAFEEVPGGVVLGLLPRVDPALAGARLVVGEGGGLVLRVDDAAFALPERSPAFLAACLAFARRSQPGDVAVDLKKDGTVLLAPELVDTEVGAILVRADRVPHRRIGLVLSKSLLLDREVRLRADAATGRAWLETDLEVRFYRPDLAFDPSDPDAARRIARRAVPWAGAVPQAHVVGALTADLAPAADVAGFVALFRWALATDPDGVEALDAIGRDLAARAAATGAFTPTPRRLDPAGGSAVPPGLLPEPSPVADWMRAHRARVGGGR